MWAVELKKKNNLLTHSNAACNTRCPLSEAITLPCNEGYKSAPRTAACMGVIVEDERRERGGHVQHRGRADSDTD